MDFTLENLWLGTEASLKAYESALEKMEAHLKSGELKAGPFDGEGDLPSLVTQHGDVAVIAMDGSLVSGSAGWMRMFGITGYEDLAAAAVAAVMNPETKAIVINSSSGGGAVNGVQEWHDLLASIDTVKPVVSFTGDNMLSAAYWSGAAARKVVSAPTGETGSIGVLTVHAERSKALAEDGMKVTVIRAGKFKALANPYEPLTAVAEAAIQEKVDAVHTIFKDSVASDRKMSSAQVNKIGQGQTYLGAQALEAGLVDQVGTLSDAISLARSEANKGANVRQSPTSSVDKRRAAADNSINSGTNDMHLTPAQLSALASGVAMEDVLKMAEPTAEDLAAAAAQVAADEAAKLAADAEAATKAAADADAAAKAAAPKPDVLEFVTKQLAEANQKTVDLTVELTALKASTAAAQASHEGLLAIARDSVAKMSVALGGTAQAGEALSGQELLAEHARLSDVFKSKFKVGGVAATKPEAKDEPAAKPVANPMFAFLSAAVPAN